MLFHSFCKALTSKLFTVRVLRLGHAIGIQHQQFAGLGRQVILMIASIPEHSEGYAAALDKTVVSIFIQQNWWIMAGVCIGQSFVGAVENSVESRYKLVSLDGFPEQIVHFCHRD